MVAVVVVAAAEIEMEGIETGTIRTVVVVVVTLELVQEKTETMTPISEAGNNNNNTRKHMSQRRTSTILTTSSVISLVRNTSNARCTKTSTRLRYESTTFTMSVEELRRLNNMDAARWDAKTKTATTPR